MWLFGVLWCHSGIYGSPLHCTADAHTNYNCTYQPRIVYIELINHKNYFIILINFKGYLNFIITFQAITAHQEGRCPKTQQI
jgi:hypothetical protein